MSKVKFTELPVDRFSGLDRLARQLEYHTKRQQLIAGNLANLDTPGYRARDLVFHERITAHMESGQTRPELTMSHADEVVTSDDETPDQDGNSVALEKQVTKSAANTVRYNAIHSLLNRKLAMLAYAAKDGR